MSLIDIIDEKRMKEMAIWRTIYLTHRKSKIHQRTCKNQECTKPLCIYEMKTHLRQPLEIKNRKTILSHISS